MDILEPAMPSIRQIFVGSNQLRLGNALTVLGRCRINSSRFEDAEAALQEADSILQTVEDASESDRSKVLSALLELYDAWEWHDPSPDRSKLRTTYRERLEMAKTAVSESDARSR